MQWLKSKFVSVLKKAFSSSTQDSDGYTLLGRLEGHSGAINCLSFTRDGTIIASGGDDETLRIWDIETLVCVQIIRDSVQKWGQITTLNWLAGDRDGNVLCFGTGRGLIVTFRRSANMIDMAETGTTRAFTSGDPVEATAFDHALKRLLVSSHYGIIKMYSLGPNDHFTVLWESTALFKNEVPRILFLTDKGHDAIIIGLEEGSMICCDAQSGAKKWDKTLNSTVVSAALCSQERYAAIDNGVEGFDIYNVQRSSPNLIRHIPVSPGRLPAYYCRGVAFGEGARTLMCGTDHGSVHVFELKTARQIQSLVHEEGRLIQAIDTVTISRKNIIASSVSEGRFDICIWVKPDGGRSQRPSRTRISCLVILNILLTVCVLWATSDSWQRLIKQVSELSVTSRLFQGVLRGRHDAAPNQSVLPTTNAPLPNDNTVTIDSETLIQLWRDAQAHRKLQSVYSETDGQLRSPAAHPDGTGSSRGLVPPDLHSYLQNIYEDADGLPDVRPQQAAYPDGTRELHDDRLPPDLSRQGEKGEGRSSDVKLQQVLYKIRQEEIAAQSVHASALA